MACLLRIRVTTPFSDSGTGAAREERPLQDAIKDAESEEADDQDSPEQWEEVARTVTEIDVGGVKIDRIIRSTFEKPTGKQVELVFAEAQSDTDVDDITTKV